MRSDIYVRSCGIFLNTFSKEEFDHFEGKIKISENLWKKTWPQLIGKLAPISEKLAPICQKLAPIYYKMDPILERWPQVPKRWPQVHRRWPQVHKRWPLLLQNLDPIARRGLWRKYKNSKKWVKLADFFGFKYIFILTNICLFWPEKIAKVWTSPLMYQDLTFPKLFQCCVPCLFICSIFPSCWDISA